MLNECGGRSRGRDEDAGNRLRYLRALGESKEHLLQRVLSQREVA